MRAKGYCERIIRMVENCEKPDVWTIRLLRHSSNVVVLMNKEAGYVVTGV